MPLPTPTLSAMTMATLTATLKSPLHTALSPTHRRARVPATPARRLTHCSTPMHICTRTRTRTRPIPLQASARCVAITPDRSPDIIIIDRLISIAPHGFADVVDVGGGGGCGGVDATKGGL